MDTAIERCYRAVPPRALRDLAPSSGSLALRCYQTGCTNCADFDVDGRTTFEERLRREYGASTRIHPWNCAVPHLRDLAREAGVTELPAYVLVSASGDVTVRPVS